VTTIRRFDDGYVDGFEDADLASWVGIV
jgi:hypothetical protein